MQKDDVNGRKSNFARRGVDFRSASVLSRGRPMSRFTHCVRSTPINHSAKWLYFFHSSIAINRPLSIFLEGINSYFQCGEVMRDNTSS
ncbi:hypothetical protein JTI58_16825 [Lysinibacillus fusiformis]|uniref:hypothetical protein n=1 Tax=Lysinibacillus fusiformis TaxID=28031 RepID=UPI001967A245|nr:hypothetical protein [Lysinibacillus fusiformis]QSB08676.1 hypothetical protein JTI58_16825 [Lysinibacillus fusiformis]